MSDNPSGPDWWLASDGKWYAPELAAGAGGPGSDSAHESSGPQPVFTSATTDTVFPSAGGTDSVVAVAGDSDSRFPAVSTDSVFPSSGTDTVFPAAGGTDSVFPSAEASPSFPTAAATAPVFPAATEPVFPAAATDSVFPATAPPSFEYPVGQYPDVQAGAGTGKSKVAAGLLAILLGFLGVHRFYLGYKAIGAIMLALSVLSLGVLVPVTLVWGIVEGILIFVGKFKTDKNGIALK